VPVGFLDDANFRWRPYRARMLAEAHATGAQMQGGVFTTLQAEYAAGARVLGWGAARAAVRRVHLRDDHMNAWRAGLLDASERPRAAPPQAVRRRGAHHRRLKRAQCLK
jgi:hypothetical protein